MPLAFVGALVLVDPAKKHDEPISYVMLYECSPRNRVVLVTAESFFEPQRGDILAADWDNHQSSTDQLQERIAAHRRRCYRKNNKE
jgi:hypothetical protein